MAKILKIWGTANLHSCVFCTTLRELWLGLGLWVAVQPRQVWKEAAVHCLLRNPMSLSRVLSLPFLPVVSFWGLRVPKFFV